MKLERKKLALIERNILVYRPSSEFSRDLTLAPGQAVLTAEGQPAVRAMEIVLREESRV